MEGMWGAVLGGPLNLGVQVWAGYRNVAHRLTMDPMDRTLVLSVPQSLGAYMASGSWH